MVKLLTFGRGGATAYVSARTTRRCASWRPDGPLPTDSEGAVVVDTRPAVETRDGFRWAVIGPLVNVDLPPGESRPLPACEPLIAAAVAGTEYGTLLALHYGTQTDGIAGPLDEVSIPAFVAGWRAVGARVGRVIDGRVVWEGSTDDV